MSDLQLINLYQEHLRPRQELLSAHNLLLWTVLLLLLTVPPTWWVRHDMEQARLRLETMKDEEKQLSALLTELAVKYPSNKGPDLTLENKLKQLTQQREMAEQAITVLDETKNRHQGGFSQLFTGLAQAKQPGVWLTSFIIDQGGTEISLQGMALRDNLIPPFVAQLQQLSVFSGRAFRWFVIERTQEGQIAFTLQAHPPAAGEENAPGPNEGLGVGGVKLRPPENGKAKP